LKSMRRSTGGLSLRYIDEYIMPWPLIIAHDPDLKRG
jgi:hypothetical protein